MAYRTKIEYLNFDSINSTDTINDAFDTNFVLMQKYTNIKKIYLKSAEIPIGFVNIRSSNNSNVLSFVLNSVSYNATITQQNYSSISFLLTALNASILTAITSSGFTFVLSIYNIPSIFSTLGNVPSALKIPLNTNTYNILFYTTDRAEYDQALTVSDTNFILSNMRIIMYARFGFPINNGILEYSFTLAIEYG